MDRNFSIPYIVTLLGIPLAAALRLWSINAAVDSQGLPVLHPSFYALLGAAGIYLLLALILSCRSPGRSGRSAVLQYGRAGALCGMVSSAMLLLGAVLEFWENLAAGPGISAPIMCLLGLLGGICAFVTVWFRQTPGKRSPGAEMMPVVYILIKLGLNFKSWSTDPIILDYCVSLFAMIFALLAYFRGAGFALDQGKPRRTLFDCMAAVFLCAAAMMDGVHVLSLSAIFTYGGFLLWQLPVIWDLLSPSGPDPKPEPSK